MNAPKPQPLSRRYRPTHRAGLEKVFLEHLDLIERVAVAAGRRAGLLQQEIEDFTSQVKLKIIEDDYAVLAKHRGDSSLSTYLTVVVNNRFKDFCNSNWGKFRPSVVAKKLGPEAQALERLLFIDRHDLETAIQILRRNYKVATAPGDLRRIAAQFPQRIQRHFVNDEVLAQQSSAALETHAERRIQDAEQSATAERVEAVLNLALETLSAQDLLILKMHYRDGLSIAKIAGALGLEQRSLYSRKTKSLARLKAVFVDQGMGWESAREVLGWQAGEIRARFDSVGNSNLDQSSSVEGHLDSRE